jgi:hypothetical protein
MECRGEEGVVFTGVAFRELPVERSRWRLPQSRNRELQGSTHYGYCVHGTHLLPIDHDHRDANTCGPQGIWAAWSMVTHSAPLSVRSLAPILSFNASR